MYNVTLDHRAENGTIKLPFSFTYPTSAPAIRQPLILLMNGASVESYWYRRVIADLASKGYVVVSADYYRDIDFPASEYTSGDGCCASFMAPTLHGTWI